ncbi:hypothetical protein [Cellulomonas dongxiuzhuiae]|uniref:Transposase n=1 Tax=Cellulomonas dongxiuzhuiae TaxID=2819979 RepID=A0ABX8GJH8_9CELL|nr:hypothetical protein [Cellulomonas dongxiuzhuiae]MBO3095355.1 hypothetical protein [Cellulomonas dongxiuzhuiae]QWC16343.1 hypothetical protein KKR89_01285 [Cellulomonas dongxiuzhuiae]
MTIPLALAVAVAVPTPPTVRPCPHTYAEVREIMHGVLPGARWRRLPLWRYALVWQHP